MAAGPQGQDATKSRWARGPGPGPPRGQQTSRGTEVSGSPVLLRLSHFSRPPFLCFGDVRVGVSRTLPLILDNPNEEVVDVRVARLPKADQGFSVSPQSFILQPKERIFVSVTWTPFNEGRVREMVTFLVNDVLKHQAILLGNAEQPKKKKRSLWDTLKKKDISSSSRLSKRRSNIKNVNNAFDLPQKSDKLRSPLQACENLVALEDCPLMGSESLNTKDNQLPVSPISPDFKKSPNEIGTPLSVRRSTTYTLLHAPENRELLKGAQDASLLKDFHLVEEVISKNMYNTVTKSVQGSNVKDHLDFSNIRLPIFSPEHSSSLHLPNQRTFLSPDSFVSDNYLANKDLESMPILSPDQFMKDDSKDTHFESQKIYEIHKPFFQRTILSPDSFVSNSYELHEDLEPVSIDPILSPDQFMKNNIAELHTSQQFAQLSLANENSPLVDSTLNWKNNKMLQFVTEDQAFPNVIPKETKLVEIKLHYSSPSNENHCKVSAVQKNPCNFKEQCKRRPILSATVTKSKPKCSERKRTGMNNPKSRRCLNNAVTDCENTEMLHAYLPNICPVVNESKSCKDKANTVSFGSTFGGYKRKSEENLEDINVMDSANEHMEVRETKRIHFSCAKSKALTVVKTKKAIVRSPASKHVSVCGKQNRKKKTDSLAYSTSGPVINRMNKPVVPVAQSHLTFIKPLKTVIPRHPLPFAARNMFYDERWKEKQEQGFTWWLNFILTPDDLTVKANISQVNAVTLLLGMENHYKISVPRAPTKDEMSLRTYTARCRLNRLRRKACRLFTSEKMVKAIKKLEVEIEARRLLVRKDKHLWKDVGERQKILNWLLSYNPLWLRIGLETVYGELISLENNSDVAGLAIFILNRLLWNPDIAAEYRHPTVPHLYGDGHEEALSRFTLKKLLLLVCFLDHAKLSRLIDHDPCLFCKDAEFKASKEILLAFSRDFLSGEGDLSRHLGFLGLPVSHIQTPLDEFEFAVTNLAVDLKCGIRLVRAMELLTKNWNLSKKLRIPAISRLQKIHNVDIVLQVLKERGVSLNDEQGNTIQSKDIVDSHRERTLALLWKIVLTFQVDILLNLDQLKEEIVFLKHSLNIKRKMTALSSYPNGLTYVKKRMQSSFSLEHHNENVKLLMDWVNAVCAFYSNKVENFTVSFSDGRVLCYLIHHYHPCYLPFEGILQRTTQTVEHAKTDSVALNSSSESDGSGLDICFGAFDHENSGLYTELLDNEKKNFQLVSSAVRNLGGIPAMVHHADMSNTIPDERVVITYLSFLCARLLDLRKETRAARVIQTTWRKYKIRANLKLYQEKDKAARVIQTAITNFLARRKVKKLFNATVIIQKHWRRYLAQRKTLILRKAKLEKIQNKSAVVIQAFWRRYSIRKRFLKLKHYTTILQARIRMLAAIAAFRQHRWAAVTIQRHWRAYLRRKEDQQKYKVLKCSSLIIQSAFRRWKRHKIELQTKAIIVLQRTFRKWKVRKLAKEEKAAIMIQSWYRMQKQMKKYTHFKLSIIVIQSRFRCLQAKKLYTKKKKSILTIQKYYRAYQKGRTERTHYLQKRNAVIQLQAAFRGMKARHLCREIRAACVIQSYYRAYIMKKKFLRMKHAIIILQAFIKMKQERRKYLTLRKSAVCIQWWYRSRRYATKCRNEYQLLRESCIKLQAVVRGHLVRKQLRSQRKAVTLLQSYFRMRKEQQHYLQIYRATVCIQNHYRAYKIQIYEREKFLEIKKAVVCLQAAYRGYKTRKLFKQISAAALKIQTAFRGYTKRLKYQAVLQSSIKIQRWYRAHKTGYVVRINFLKIRAAVIFLQSVYRGWKVRKWLQRECNAAVIIQCAFRRVKAQKKFRLMKNAALTIQQRYRAKILEKKWQKEYTDLYHAALRLQAAWRGRAVRRQIKRQNQSAVIIQSYFRMYIYQKKWKTVKTAALQIQSYYKAYKSRKQKYSLYLKRKTATIILQSAYRGMRVRKQMKELHKAAITIQAKYKSYSSRKKYLALRDAAITTQRRYRALAKANHQHWEYLVLRNTTIKMQAVYRGVRVRRQIQHMNKAATYIKAVFKMHQLRAKYRAMRRAAIIIQVRYRAYCQGKVQRKNYLIILQSTITLQAAFRGTRVRQKLQKMKVIPSDYQKYTQQKHLDELCKLTKLLQQQQHCTVKERDISLCKYSILRHSVVRIQAAFRGMKTRQHLKGTHLAATLIQRKFRARVIRKRYLSLKKATILIQQKYRATVCAKRELQQYLCLRKAVIVLQSHYRRFMVKKKIQEMHQAATIIQIAFRRHRADVSYQAMKHTCIVSQQHSFVYREQKLQMEDYPKQQNSVVVNQAAYRRMKAYQLLQKKHNAAVIIQSSYRMYKQYCYYQDIQWASKVIQRRYRVYKERKKTLQHCFIMKKETACSQATLGTAKERQEYQTPFGGQNNFKVHHNNLSFRAATVLLRRNRTLIKTCVPTERLTYMQPFYKGIKPQRNYLHMHQAATLIQATFRMHKARVSYQTMRTAAVVIQTYYRSYSKTKIERYTFLTKRKYILTIQAAFRGMKARQEFKNMLEREMAAIIIQSAFHHYRTKIQFKGSQNASAVFQGRQINPQRRAERTTYYTFHKMIARKLVKQDDDSQEIQALFWMAMYQGEFVRQRRSAVILQAYLRKWQVRTPSILYRKSALSLQDHYRTYLFLEYQRKIYLRTQSSIIKIQASVKGFIQWQKFQKIKNSTIKIQATWRGYKARQFLCKMRAAQKIQASFRCYKVRKDYLAMKKAIRVIQNVLYTKLQRTWFLNLRLSTITLQRKWRATLETKKAREHFLLMREATIKIQSVYRGYCVRNQMVKSHKAACLIQAVYRGYKRRQNFLQIKAASVIIQRHFQARKAGMCERLKYLRMKKAIIMLQALVRGWLVRKKNCFQARVQQKIPIQNCPNIKGQQTAQECWIQRNRAATVIQRATRNFLFHRREEKLKNRISKIQALWRGYSWRKKNDFSEIKAIRLSLQEANRKSQEENKLYKRTALAIHYLLKYKHLSYILEALKHLEVATRLSPLCCENIAQSGAIAKIFVLILSCNRSIPCMEVITYAVQVLLNVAKYEKTAPAVYGEDNCIDTLLELLQTYREKAGDKVADKGGSIFTKTCCLLAILLKTSRRASDIRSRPKVVNRICSLYKLTARKHKMCTERIITKQKMNATNGHFFIPPTPVRTKIVSRLKPDWVLRKDNMQEIVNPLQAIQMVMDTLGIPY
ncbi:abnormal spindle-like microcephaly-associated protein isoform X1 [Monodelphis domestica]|uniref:abnormal spindle-like microcephaly-associated protein isoform X1 n=1 Tax=Monodelphis domestica TaxID=13616 RepID=UPI0024E1EEAC|nr:abnormal spindle-like microcephaly-associated protein isoform X1 [Monodelphis domestica]